jgi:hypothetical protein
MLFQPEHITPILLDLKTQTRRACHPQTDVRERDAVLSIDRGQGTSRTRFEVGRVEPIMPGRGRFQAAYKNIGGEPRWAELQAALGDVTARGEIWARGQLRRDRDRGVQMLRDAGWTLLYMQTLAIAFDDDVVNISDADAIAEGVPASTEYPGETYLHVFYRINQPAICRKLKEIPIAGWREYLRNETPAEERQCWKIDFKRYVVTTD